MLTKERRMNMIELLRKFFTNLTLDKKGQDLTEYALLVALIAIVVMVAIIFFGEEVSGFFSDLATEIATWVVPPGGP